jgi:hypothetical protein
MKRRSDRLTDWFIRERSSTTRAMNQRGCAREFKPTRQPHGQRHQLRIWKHIRSKRSTGRASEEWGNKGQKSWVHALISRTIQMILTIARGDTREKSDELKDGG